MNLERIKYPGIEFRCTRIAGVRRRDKHARTAERPRQRPDILRALASAEQETC